MEFLENWNVEDALFLGFVPFAMVLCSTPPGSCDPLRTLAALADAHDEAFLVTRTADADGFRPGDLLYALETPLGWQCLDVLVAGPSLDR